MGVAINLQATSFSYSPSSPPAVREVSIQIQPGEIVVFFGPNGSGKSTLMKVINGLLKPAGGRISFSPEIGPLGMVYLHQYPYVLNTTVRGNIEFPLRARSIARPTRRKRVEDWIQRMELGPIADSPARDLSGGQKQQVCLARSLVAEPELVFLDEPTAHVDRDVRERLLRLLTAEHRRRAMTIVIATHDRGFGFGLGSRFFRFDDGSVSEETINVLEGTVTEQSEHLVRFAIPGGPDLMTVEHPGMDVSGARRAVFSDEDLLLSATPIGGSALNQLTTTVQEVVCTDGQCRVLLDAGYPVEAIVTERSRNALAIEPGARIYVALKASSVRLY